MQYDELLTDDVAWAERARKFSARVRDWATVFRTVAERVPLQGQNHRVALQNSCHLVNVEHAGEDSVKLLQNVPGDTFIPYSGQDRCCGSAGIYNIEHPDWALAILAEKMDTLESVHPDIIVVNNPGCHLQMRQGAIRRYGNGNMVQHLAVYLEYAAEKAENRRDGREQKHA